MSHDEQAAQQALTERQKMELGLPYDGIFDDELLEGRMRAREHLEAYNNYPVAKFKPGIGPGQFFGPDERLQHLANLFGLSLETVKNQIAIQPPFYCDYGTNIEFKGHCYMNFGVTILDAAKVVIGARAAFGPGVHIYSASHSTRVEERRDLTSGIGRSYPVTIGDDAWIGGHVTIIGPCKIGNGVTIAAGSVVKGDIPDNVVIGGNPARILKHLTPPPPLEAEKH